jgi:hypothetical protein
MSFIHLGFLAAGLAVAVPIVIHLLFRQKTRDVSIGSIRFLQQVVKEHRRRRWLRQWILLALRALAVLLLAALFARPYWDRAQQQAREREVVLLVDRSASMGATDASGQAAFAQAMEQLQAELKTLPESVIVHVAFADGAGIKEVPIAELSSISTSEAATDHALAIEWARDVLQQSKRTQRQIVYWTDIQRSGLGSATQQLPANVELQVRDVGEALPSNLAIVSVEAAQTEIQPDVPVSVRVIVRNFSPLAARAVEVACELQGPQGKVVAKKEVDIAPHGAAAVDLTIDAKEDGIYHGKVEIITTNTGRRDTFALDNRRWLAFEARKPERVLLIDGQEGRSVFQNETYYLETALRVRSEEAGGRIRSFEPERIVWESGDGFPRLDGYRAIVLANVRRLTERDADRLHAYLQAGGNLLIFAGDQVSQASLEPLAAKGLLPGEIADRTVDHSLRVTSWPKEHSALALFSDPQQGDLRRIQVNTSLPVSKLHADSAALLTANDQVLAAERPVGKGLVLYVAFTADRDWTELPQSRLYVPLMRQLLAHLTNQLQARSPIREQLVKKQGDQIGMAEVAGKWQVTNLDPGESAPERIAAADLQKLFGSDGVTAEQRAEKDALALLLPADSLRPDEVWQLVAWVLLIVLAAETLLAGRVHA